jgi:prophage antirepressor-like protein
MDYNETVAVFESKHIRRYYDSVNEVWYFALVDIVAALTDSANATDYLKKIRKRDEELHFYLGTNCPQVEMQTESGKKRKTLAGNAQQVFRLIQSIPSPKAEPFKQWLAKVGYERIIPIFVFNKNHLAVLPMETATYSTTLVKTYRRLFSCLMFYH